MLITKRRNYDSGSKWEALVGYSRAVRKGPFIYVSGSTAIDERGQIVGEDDAYKQTVQTIANIKTALEKLGAKLEDVVRTRIYLKDISDWDDVGRAHQEAFGQILPATSMLEVSSLISPEMLVEIEADALIESSSLDSEN